MLVLSRKLNESIVIGDNIVIKVTKLEGDTVRLGIEAPRDISVHRKEVLDVISESNKAAIMSPSRSAKEAMQSSIMEDAQSALRGVTSKKG